MSREIKFRAFTKEGRMQYNVTPWQWDFVIDTMGHKCIESNGVGLLGSGGTEGRFEVRGVAHTALMQYTGLKDKNGREIYEGDIVIHEDAHGPCVIEYQPAEYVACDREKMGYDPCAPCEVIGNIHENPELLK